MNFSGGSNYSFMGSDNALPQYVAPVSQMGGQYSQMGQSDYSPWQMAAMAETAQQGREESRNGLQQSSPQQWTMQNRAFQQHPQGTFSYRTNQFSHMQGAPKNCAINGGLMGHSMMPLGDAMPYDVTSYMF